ncbi:hypothetical protein ONE63_000809 [Megalurothrips usitatus]|uniref:Glycosylated lysosomal membrane protein B-like n=1 Tax=Megalurothrips usitatus TaxID=439358 RepID=A0AAV7Y342_9NEOP|nr:hypothetical protein ONE63_000809 [Megalurothrips usitatus]
MYLKGKKKAEVGHLYSYSINTFLLQLKFELNPGCPKELCNSKVEIVYVRADGPNDTLHYVWCFDPKPTVLITLTSHASNLTITWGESPLSIYSIAFTSKPYYSFGLLVNQIFEFDDVDDNGILNVTNNNASYVRRVQMPDSWVMKNPIEITHDSALLVMEGSWKNNVSSVKQGTFQVELETYRSEGHGSKLPHLFHSPNTTQMELSLFNMLTNSGFKQSRFAIELVLAASENTAKNISYTSFKSLDDEHTPGVFTLNDLQTPASKRSGNGGFVQWRPVSYVAEERDIVNSTESAVYAVQNISDSSSDYDGTLLGAYFGSGLSTNLLNSVNISFGAKDDGFYAKCNTSIWTATVGYGHPPVENFSLLVILIMVIFLGLPAVIILFSGLYVALRRITYRKDDLFLSE